MTKQEMSVQVICENRRAFHDYFIEERYEAGLVLTGWEVKSLRARSAHLSESYIILREEQAWVVGMHVTPLNTISTHVTPDPIRTRKLLLHHRELDKLLGAVTRRGYTLVPIKLYFKKGRAKLEFGIAKGKKQYDKRATEKARDWQREKARLLSSTKRG